MMHFALLLFLVSCSFSSIGVVVDDFTLHMRHNKNFRNRKSFQQYATTGADIQRNELQKSLSFVTYSVKEQWPRLLR